MNKQLEIIKDLGKGKFIVHFPETGGKVIATQRQINHGTVKDPLEIAPQAERKHRWEVLLTSGDTFTAFELGSVAERTGVHEATVRKIAQGIRKHPSIQSITKI